MSHLQRSTPAAASPLLCCDSRLSHQTAGPCRVSADPSAADAGSIREGKKINKNNYWHTRREEKRVARLKALSNWPSVPPPACGQQHWCRFQLNRELPAASSVLSLLESGGSDEHGPTIILLYFKNCPYPLFWPAAQRDTVPARWEVCPGPFGPGGDENVEELRHCCEELTFVQIRFPYF